MGIGKGEQFGVTESGFIGQFPEKVLGSRYSDVRRATQQLIKGIPNDRRIQTVGAVHSVPMVEGRYDVLLGIPRAVPSIWSVLHVVVGILTFTVPAGDNVSTTFSTGKGGGQVGQRTLRKCTRSAGALIGWRSSEMNRITGLIVTDPRQQIRVSNVRSTLACRR